MSSFNLLPDLTDHNWMPYASVSELPLTVRTKLKSPKRQRQWMHVWNSEYTKHGDESRAFASAWSAVQKGTSSMSDAFNLFLPLSKAERQRDGSVLVSGYCSTPTLDLDGEIVSLDAIRKALPGYWAWRNIRQMHQASAVGVGKEANVDSNGCFLTAKITDKEAAQKCLDGVYKGFSIGGKKLNKTGNTITEIEWVETSIVDRPANPECKFDVAKKAKDGEGAFLVKLAKQEKTVPKNLSKALASLSQVAEFLTKDGPKAAKDGFSLPAKVEKSGEKCAAHGMVDCKVCKEAAVGDSRKLADDDTDDAGARGDTTKREVSRKERKALARQGKALPGGGYPIKNEDDLTNARRSVGRAKNPNAARALIRRRARELGVKLPDKWSKKSARAAFAEAELAKNNLAGSSFLTLSAEDDRGFVKGAGRLGHGSLSSATEMTSEEGDNVFRQLFTKNERKLLKGMGIAGQLAYCFDSVRSAQRSLLMEAKREGGDMKDKALAEKLGSLAQGLAAVIGQKAEHEGAEALDLSDADDQGFLNLGGLEMSAKTAKTNDGGLDFNTDGISDPIMKGLLDTIKRASVPSRVARMTMARSDLKKARKAAKDLEESITDAHKMHKTAYLAKAAKKPKDDGDADDFDHQGAMEKLQKAFSNLQTVKTMMKSAGGQLKKAASRSGQRGEEVSDGNADYVVPQGVKDLTPGGVDTAGGTSEPFIHGMETPFPGKSAKALLTKYAKDGKIPIELAEMFAENASLAGQVEALGKMPAGAVFGKKPTLFDMSKIVGGGNAKGDEAIIMKDVDPADLTKDEQSNQRAVAKMIGNMIVGGAGKSVFDTDFRGTGGLG